MDSHTNDLVIFSFLFFCFYFPFSSFYFQFLFPGGPVVKFSKESPQYYVVALTNEKGIKSYMYVCLFFEEANYKDYIDIPVLNTVDFITNNQIKVKEIDNSNNIY